MARLLVVDDEHDFRDLVVKRLRRLGHEVLSAGGADEALACTARDPSVDAVVLDVAMPGMDGVDLLCGLRQRWPGLPALFVTVLWGADVHARIDATGAGYLAKPCTAAQLDVAVNRVLGGAGSRRDR